MSSPREVKTNQAESSGKETLEYRRVQANLVKINATLTENKEAEEVLRQTFQQKGWIEMGADTSGDELMVVVLDRINRFPDTYDEFMEILGHIKDLDLIKGEIQETIFPVQESHNDRKVESSSTAIEPSGYAVVHDSGVKAMKGKEQVSDQGILDSGRDTDTEVKASPKRKPVSTRKIMSRSMPSQTEDKPGPVLMDGAAADEPDNPTTMPGAATALSSDTYSDQTSPGTMLITGGEADHQQEEMIARINKLEEEVKSKEKLLEEAKAKIEECEEVIAQLQQQNKALLADNEELRTKCEKAKAAKEEAELQHATVTDELKALKRRVSELGEEVSTLRERLCKVEEERVEQDRNKVLQDQMKHQEEMIRKILEKLSISDQ